MSSQGLEALRGGAVCGRGHVRGVVLHDAAQPKVGQLAHVAARVVAADRRALQQHVGALQVRLRARGNRVSLGFHTGRSATAALFNTTLAPFRSACARGAIGFC